MRPWHRAWAVCIFLAATIPMNMGCGYKARNTGRLPQTLHIIAIPAFVNQTQTYRIEQTLTAAVVREFNSRTNFTILNEASDTADATLKGTVLSTLVAPLTYDSKTGRASSATVTVSVSLSLTGRGKQSLYENPNMVFREQYQVSREISSFFEEDSPAFERLSRDFARSVVSNILEAY